MSTASFIRRHINDLPEESLFTTRDCLIYGPRTAVDRALHRLVKSGYIKRLARGVFLKSDLPNPKVSAIQVATVKAAAFGKQIISHAADAACKLQLIAGGNLEPTFAINGHSSSFKFGSTRIHLLGSAPRKMKLGDSLAGLVIRALWHLGKRQVNRDTIDLALRPVRRDDREEIRRQAVLMPSWLSKFLCRLVRWPHGAPGGRGGSRNPLLVAMILKNLVASCKENKCKSADGS